MHDDDGNIHGGRSMAYLTAARESDARQAREPRAPGAAAGDAPLPAGTLLMTLGLAAAWAAALTLLVLSARAGGLHGYAGVRAEGASSDGGGPLLVWLLMMAVMMLPGSRRARSRRGNTAVLRSALYLGGRVVVWAAFAVVAAVAQVELVTLGLLDAGSVLVSPRAAAALLAVVGLFQLAALGRYRGAEASAADGLAVGLERGVGSFSSCSLVMLVPLAIGGMSLVGMALLTALLAAEKLEAAGLTTARGAGFALLGLGIYVLVATGGG